MFLNVHTTRFLSLSSCSFHQPSLPAEKGAWKISRARLLYYTQDTRAK